MRPIAPLLLLALAPLGLAQEDLREAYDVQAYRLVLRFDPEQRRIEGTVSMEALVVAEELEFLRLDLAAGMVVERTIYTLGSLRENSPAKGQVVFHEHVKDRLDCHLPKPVKRGKIITLSVTYSGSPGEIDRARGVRWMSGKPGDGKEPVPLVDISLQNAGAHHWFPCKASRFHPEDRPNRVLIDATVPDGLVAAATGRQVGRLEPEQGWITWRWRHDYPIPTYSIAVAIAPFESVTERLVLPELDEPVQLQYFVLPGDLPAARTQFAELGEILTVYTAAFGPWPFPKSKVGVAQGTWLTADHSTLISYGSSFPAWREAQGEEDPLARWNRGYDYVLTHQLAHEWWGNAVGARSWRDAWLHEGFATFAEGLWLEHRHGRPRADEFFSGMARRLRSSLHLIRADADEDSERAFSPVLYLKGAWVLHLVRHYMANDEHFFGALRRFQSEHRYGLASSEDLRRAIEAETGQEWGRFFDEWVYGTGSPRLEGKVSVHADRLEVQVVNEVSAARSFRVPLDLAWLEDGEEVRERLWLEPGGHALTVPCAHPEDVRVVDLQRLLGRHRVVVGD